MANQLYQQMTNQQPNGMEQMFMQFMSNTRGQNPRQIIDRMVQTGQLSQSQLNMVQQRAQQMSGMFDAFRSKFGF